MGTGQTARRGGRVPSKLVLLVSSTMLGVGLVAWASAGFTLGGRPRDPDAPPPVDARTPEATAESFLDAWRKREHDIASALSTGPARARVEARRQRDDALTAEERGIKEQVWDAMASSRLGLEISESQRGGDGRLSLRGAMVGEFVGRPYRRGVSFQLVEVQGRWFVEDMDFGEITTEVPEVLEVDPERDDPGAIEMRGAEVP